MQRMQSIFILRTVHLKADGSAVCGRCPAPSSCFTKDKYYEAAARHLMFPCRYQEVPVSFSVDGQHPHELQCDYKPYKCLVTSDEECLWFGRKSKILEHTDNVHPLKVITNSQLIDHNLTESNMKKYLLHVFDYLFILNVKVCRRSGKIYYLIQHLTDTTATEKYSYKVCITEKMLEKNGQVALENSESNVIENNPLSVELNIKKVIPSICSSRRSMVITTSSFITMKVNCANANCGSNITNFIYRNHRGWLCEKCSPARLTCPNCKSFKDLRNKCFKHEWFYCPSIIECILCSKQLPPEKGNDNVCNPNNVIQDNDKLQVSPNQGKRYLVNSVIGLLICEYWLDDSKFELYIRSSLASYLLQYFYCTISVSDLSGKVQTNYMPNVDYENDHDWHIEVNSTDFPANKNSFNVCVKLSEKRNT